MKFFTFFLLALLMFSHTSEAQSFSGSGIFRQSGDEESVGWTLSGWLSQKQNFKSMDNWLAMNKTLDRFEVNIDGGQQRYDYISNAQTVSRVIDRYGVSVYWSIFGIEYQLEDSDEDFKRQSAQINVRLYGVSSTGTNLTAFYGVRKWEYENPVNEVENQYAGAKAIIHLTSFFGLNGEYKKNFSADDSNQNQYEGDRVEYGAFIDISVLRIYGKGFKEKNTITDSLGADTAEERDGFEAGFAFRF